MSNKPRHFDINNYDLYVSDFKRMSLERNRTITHSELRLPQFNLPDARWLIVNCPDKNVKTWTGFVNWCGFSAKGYMTKEVAIGLIYKMQDQIKRPLMYDDFRGWGCYKVSLTYIREYWGTMNKMKENLGLEIVQESMMDKQISKEEFIRQVNNLIMLCKSHNKDFITTKYIDSNSDYLNSNTLRTMASKYFNMSLSDYIKLQGFKMGEQGKGIVFKFADGEKTTSQFEYIFSNYLRDFGFIYGVDYFRDVNYKDFVEGYNQRMNCDYLIKYKGKNIYIEIAGIIEAYKLWYYEDKTIINSKSKEKYRLKLKEKEKMLKDNNLIYFILFPCDLTRDIFMQIFNDGSLELKNNIEMFMKNNIDWVKIKHIGELKYKENETTRHGQLVVDYDSKEVS